MRNFTSTTALAVGIAIFTVLLCSQVKAGSMQSLNDAYSFCFSEINIPNACASEPCLEIAVCLGSADLPLNLTNYLASGIPTGGTWISSGPDASALSGSIFNPSLPGFYVLTYSIANGVCSDSESIAVVVYPPINADIEGITLCQSPVGTINLGAMLLPTTTSGGQFTVQSSTGVTSITLSPSGTQLIYTILTNTPPYSITVRYTVTGGTNTAPCATTFDEAIITISGATEAGFDLPDAWCANNMGLDLANYTDLLGGTWSLVTPDAGAISGSLYTPTPNFNGLVQIDYLPPIGACGTSGTQFMNVNWLSAALSVPEIGFCINNADLPLQLSSLFLPSTTPGGDWYISGSSRAPLSNDSFNPGANGLYVIWYDVDNGICADSFSFQINVTDHIPPQQLTLNALGAMGNTLVANEVCPNGQLLLSAFVSGGQAPYSYAWSGNGISNQNNEQFTITPAASPGEQLVYSLLLTDNMGCTLLQSTGVTVSNNDACFATGVETIGDGASDKVLFYPNPSPNGQCYLLLHFPTSNITTGKLSIHNIIGQLVWQQWVDLQIGTTAQPPPLTLFITRHVHSLFTIWQASIYCQTHNSVAQIQ